MYEVMKEIEAKAPQLIKQREDYENALETLDNMTRQWDTAMLVRTNSKFRFSSLSCHVAAKS